MRSPHPNPPPLAGEGIRWRRRCALLPLPRLRGRAGVGACRERHVARSGRSSWRCCGAAGGRPILLVHGINPVSPQAPFLDLLAEHGEVIAPSHPGFGDSPRPEDFDTMYDLVHLYRDVLDALPDQAALIGFSFGGWIAAESPSAGIRSSTGWSGRSGRHQTRRPRGTRHRPFLQHQPGRAEPPRLARSRQAARRDLRAGLAGLQSTTTMTDEDMVTLARNWDSLCLYAWRPHLYNPQLKHWLRRISVPTLVLWGASDRIVTPEYGRRYAGLIPGRPVRADRGRRSPPRTRTAARFCRRGCPFFGKVMSLRGATRGSNLGDGTRCEDFFLAKRVA